MTYGLWGRLACCKLPPPRIVHGAVDRPPAPFAGAKLVATALSVVERDPRGGAVRDGRRRVRDQNEINSEQLMLIAVAGCSTDHADDAGRPRLRRKTKALSDGDMINRTDARGALPQDKSREGAYVGITEQNLSCSNRARSGHPLATLEKICERLACQPGDILEWTRRWRGRWRRHGRRVSSGAAFAPHGLQQGAHGREPVLLNHPP